LTATITASGKAHTGYRHEALLYAGRKGFLDAVVPFIRDGIARRQPVMVAVIPERIADLTAALGAQAKDASFVDMAALGANPARIIPAWRAFVETSCGPDVPVRGVGEPIWVGRGATEIVECQLHESLLNMAVGPDVPLWLLCPYDVDALDPAVIEEAHRSHPAVIQDENYRGSVTYGGAYHAGSMFGRPFAEPPGHVDRLPVGTPNAQVHAWVRSMAASAGLTPLRCEQLAGATQNVVTAAAREAGEVQVRWWQDESWVVAEIRDQGTIGDPMVGRPPGAAETARGRAIRLANALCDLVQVRSASGGTAVRVRCWR